MCVLSWHQQRFLLPWKTIKAKPNRLVYSTNPSNKLGKPRKTARSQKDNSHNLPSAVIYYLLFYFVIYSNYYAMRCSEPLWCCLRLSSCGAESSDKLNINTIIMFCSYINIILRCQNGKFAAFITLSHICDFRGKDNCSVVRQAETFPRIFLPEKVVRLLFSLAVLNDDCQLSNVDFVN